jgi:hypothetical protein
MHWNQLPVDKMGSGWFSATWFFILSVAGAGFPGTVPVWAAFQTMFFTM